MPVITYSKRGGMIGGIEEIEALYPESLNRIYINFQDGLRMEDTYEITTKLGIPLTMHSKLLFILKNLYECFK
jgi:succinyl-CoA synthetase beta subunit